MRLHTTILLFACLSPSLFAQTRTTIAILPAHGASPRVYMTPSEQQKLAVESKLVDDLVSKLAGNPNLEILDRTRIQSVLAEQNNKMSDRFNPAQAPQLGHLLGADALIYVNLEGFEATESEDSKNQFIYIRTTDTGDVHLEIHATEIAPY